MSLNYIRNAIHRSRRTAFTYQGTKMVADFYLLGNARKSGEFVIYVWCHEPVPEWRLLSCSLLRDLQSVGFIEELRPDFDPDHPDVVLVDTKAHSLPRRDSANSERFAAVPDLIHDSGPRGHTPTVLRIHDHG